MEVKPKVKSKSNQSFETYPGNSENSTLSKTFILFFDSVFQREGDIWKHHCDALQIPANQLNSLGNIWVSPTPNRQLVICISRYSNGISMNQVRYRMHHEQRLLFQHIRVSTELQPRNKDISLPNQNDCEKVINDWRI